MKDIILPIKETQRSYLIRAYFDWAQDYAYTLFLTVHATYHGVKVPIEYVKNGNIVLNISPDAIKNLEFSRNSITFNACFQGVPTFIVLPTASVTHLQLQDQNNDKEIILLHLEPQDSNINAEKFLDNNEFSPKPPKGPSLRIIK